MSFTRFERGLVYLLAFSLCTGVVANRVVTLFKPAGVWEPGPSVAAAAPGSPGLNAAGDELSEAGSQAALPPEEESAPQGAFIQGRLDLNRATAADLETLPGIGPALAGRIIALRESQGAFSAVDELLFVKGIGEKTLAKIARLVFVSPTETSPTPDAPQSGTGTGSGHGKSS